MNISTKPADYFRKLLAFCELIILLMSRDIRARFHDNILSYVMVLAVPLAWITITVVSFQLLSRTVPIFTDDISFVIAGILPYLLFRYTITATMRSRSFYASLAVVAPVKRGHVTFSLAAVEFVNAVVIYIIVSFINFMVFSRWEVCKPILIFDGMLRAWLLGFSFGYFCDALSGRFPLVYKIVPVILRPMFLISAVFYTANELPYSIFSVLGWNPLLHVNEIVREGMFEGYHSFYVEPLYPLAFSATLFLSGVIFRRLYGTDNH
ncbi:Vi polysaccharide ABC transporter inner membrane protein VexB [Citrobacter amalonaticus]|uniref:Vi polysaccharide ABC transporter inner membrane protein VexB n=1 Tax=Citrobacter amalonaticus TaxID=35703 RepID=A0A2S4RWM9_CITAM|nr:Vi polysaccharide ABC transporter inner membrane protein VexB [Citrobacter amalonaticus]POT57211.1 Vi polysaccharide ABC transporter inner membrane protein VexB [Citrobacter amalonaticus]POT75236.1 Vi polysaccharide ABC transporter inner membrane protein VexB [Citrobacter amalonaticus]POU64760.1 Vi polysaccharide ABC transporter inner membrane protein VexB [Citrobacter amalonaticus]POV04835.1 Vi polysaccharide ABC transporter inner membrane protein VexB [Citrobacter amalonaticus]